MRLLEQLYKELLSEAVELNTPDTIIRAIIRGQVPGVKRREFFNREIEEQDKYIRKGLSTLIDVLNSRVSKDDFNRYMILFLQKAKIARVFGHFDERALGEMVDGFKAYFGNINKKEVKEDEEIKQRFIEFAQEKLYLNRVKEFEQWANETFVEKAKMKKDDAQIIYDKDGWQVIVPKTFAAAKEYACMNGRKAQWCTAAQSAHYDNYTNNGADDIYIIRSEKRDKMFQMDFGNKGIANFKNESDDAATISEIKKAGVPDDLLAFLKNKEGKSIKDSIDDFRKRNSKESRKISLSNKEIGTEWTNKRFASFSGLRKAFLSDTGSSEIFFIDSIEFPDALFDHPDNNKRKGNLEKVLSGDADKKIIFGRIQKGSEIYYYIVPSYGIVKYQIEGSHNYAETKEGLLIRVLKNEEGDSAIEVVSNKTFASMELPNAVKSLLLDRNLKTKENKETEYKKEKTNTVKLGQNWKNEETIIKDIKSLNTIFNADISEPTLERLKRELGKISIKTIAFIILKSYEINLYFKDGTMKMLGETSSFMKNKIKLFNYSKETRMEILSQMKKYNISNINSLQDNVVRAIYEFENEAVLKRYKNFEVYFDPKPELSTGLPISYFKVRGIGDYKVSETLKTVNVESFANKEENDKIADELRNLVRPYYPIMHFFHSKKDKEMFFSNIKHFERSRTI